jgi:vitellogenic carboxypeptidase-like protein
MGMDVSFAMRQYAGLVTVNSLAVGQLFYWFFEISDASKNNKMTPLIVWLNGGPGASSMTGLMAEMGPYRLTKEGRLTPNPHSWSSVAHVLFFDQPVGTGYSAVRDDNGYVSNQDEMAAQLYRAMQGFFALHPEYLENPMFICGESYAGKYVPSISHYIHERNAELALTKAPDDDVVINLKGIAIGNGQMWPVLQARSVPDFAIALGLIDSQQYEQANADISVCEEFHRQGRHVDAFRVCQSVLDQVQHALYPTCCVAGRKR